LALPANFARQFLIVVVLTIGLLGAMAAFSDISEVWASIRSLGWQGWAIILGLSLVNYLLRFVRWDFYLRRLGYQVPLSANLSIYLAGFGFTTTPGKVGEVVRTVYLKPYGVSYIHGLSAFFVERLVDMISMIIVASLAAYAFESTRWLVVLTFIVTVAFLPMVHSEAIHNFLERRRQGFKSLRFRSMGEHFLGLLRSSADLLQSGPLYVGLALGLLAWAAEGYGLYIVLERMDVATPFYLAAGIYGVSVLAGVVSFMPGGLGGTELAMGSLLILTGIDSPIAVSAVIICRLATLWFAVAIGLAFVVGIEFGGLAKKMPLNQDAGTVDSGE
jgi:uncharacterized protein (TIRG00374 family)